MMREIAVTLILLSAAVRVWLEGRQQRCLIAQRFSEAPPWTEHGTFLRAIDGAISRSRIAAAGILAEALVMLALATAGLSAISKLESIMALGPVLGAVVLGAVVLLSVGCVRRTVEAGNTFLVDTALGLGRPPIGLFLADTFTRMLAASWVAVPLLTIAAFFLETRHPAWWLFAWGSWLLLTALDTAVRPLVMSRLLYQASPLDNEALARRIGALLGSCGLQLGRVSVLDASRRTRRANASVHGLGRTKHIFLHDTLLDHLSENEVLAVVAHEAGHARLMHLWRQLLMLAILGLGAAGAFSIVAGNGSLATPEKIGLMTIVVSSAGFLVRPVVLAQSRRFEFEADEFAARKLGPRPMIGALERLYAANAGGWLIDVYFTAFHASHPPASKRLGRLQEIERDGLTT